MLALILVLQFCAELALGQYGCGQQAFPQPFPQPAPILPPSPCNYATTQMPPIIQPIPNCKGCPTQWQLPQLLPVPRIYPDAPQGEYLSRPNDQFYVKDTKVIRHELEENATRGEQYDEPQRNTTFHSSPIVPEVASYKHPQYYYNNYVQPNYAQPNYVQPQQYGFGCGPTPPPPTLPTLPPLVLPTLPPLQPLLPPLNNCCGRCTSCPLPSGYYGPRMRAARLFRRDQDVRCTNRKLGQIMEENSHLPIEEAKLKIQRTAELQLQEGYFHVFCSKMNLEYVTRTENFCTAEMVDGICYAFRTQAFV